MASRINLEGKRGDGEIYEFTLTEDDEPMDLTGADVWMTAKRKYADADADAIFQKSVGSGIVITDDTGGVITVTLDPADTSSLGNARTKLLYDIQTKLADDSIHTPVEGNLTVTPDVTLSTS